jgi:hypothetical protein
MRCRFTLQTGSEAGPFFGHEARVSGHIEEQNGV